MKNAKLGAIFVIAVMALAGIGAAYAHWEDTIYVEGKMKTDDIDVYFEGDCTDTNDPKYNEETKLPEFPLRADPNSCGYWDENGDWHGDEGVEPERRDKDVGWCELSVDCSENTLTIKIGDAYPCYYAHPRFCIRNRGSCPVQVYGVQLLEVSEGNHVITLDRPITLEVCTTWYVKIYYEEGDPAGQPGEWKAKVRANVNNPWDYDFSLHLTGDDMAPGTQLDPTAWAYEETWHMDCDDYTMSLYGDLNIHFENGCEQKTKYDFKIGITFWNWPEVVIDD